MLIQAKPADASHRCVGRFPEVSMSRASQLEKAMQQRRLVRFSRRYEDATVRGYVLEVGPKFFLLLVVSDRIWFDGFECFRIADISKLRPDPYAEFVETALRKRTAARPPKPAVSLHSIKELLDSVSRAFPLVTIHLERTSPDVCYIGRVLGIRKGNVSLVEIRPDATWEETPTNYRLKDITRVNFGGDYEDALHIVGGHPYGG